VSGQFIGYRTAFNADKAIAAIGYLVNSTGADLYSVMKMVYLADKVHLSRYGRTVSGEEYAAMKNGPVPEFSYALCKFLQGKKGHFEPKPDAKEFLVLNGNDFELLRAPDMDELSLSDREALDEAVNVYRAGGWRAVRKHSHDRAFDAAWNAAEARNSGSNPMAVAAIASILPNGPELIEFLSDPHPGHVEGGCEFASA
jgi:hypothetical protein